jgi:hypothetical protein
MGEGEVSGHRSETCWAAARHLPVICPMRTQCEAVSLERDALRVEVDGLRSEIVRLHAMNLATTGQCIGQAEILTKRAERTSADDLRDGEGEG